MTLLKTNLPCPDCGSSDALAQYSDGTYCFSCGRARGEGGERNRGEGSGTEKILDNEEEIEYPYTIGNTLGIDLSNLRYQLKNDNKRNDYNLKYSNKENDFNLKYGNERMIELKFPYRGLTKETFETFNVHTHNDWLVFPQGPNAAGLRKINSKEFLTQGSMKEAPLFGMDIPASGSYVTLAEGQIDTMSIYQMLGSKYPVYHIGSASTALSNAKRFFQELNKFERIYLCMDSDEKGQDALAKVASLFNPNKVYHVQMKHHKDANDYLTSGHSKLFVSAWWDAKPYLPVGIVGDYESIFEILDSDTAKPIGTYPFDKLQSMTYGIRSGEVVLFTAQEKVGKTEIMRAIEYHLLQTTDYNVGIIHLEEDEKRTIQGIAGYQLKKPVHLPDSGISTKEMKEAYVKATKTNQRCFLYKHFGSDDATVILDTIRYLVASCNCKFIFLDHITMLVTGFNNEDERKTLDYLSTQLAMMTRELDFTLFLVSHVNDDGKTRGSRNISKIADLIVHLDRNLETELLEERNKTKLMVKGNRFAGISGPSSVLWFDLGSFTYEEIGKASFLGETSQGTFGSEDQSSDSGSDTLWAQASPTKHQEGSSTGEDVFGLRKTTEHDTTPPF